MSSEILDFVYEEDIKILFHASDNSVDQVGLLDELGEPVGVEPPSGGHVAPVVCQCVSRERRRELEYQPFGVLFRPEKRPVAEAVEKPEVGKKRDVRREVA